MAAIIATSITEKLMHDGETAMSMGQLNMASDGQSVFVLYRGATPAGWGERGTVGKYDLEGNKDYGFNLELEKTTLGDTAYRMSYCNSRLYVSGVSNNTSQGTFVFTSDGKYEGKLDLPVGVQVESICKIDGQLVVFGTVTGNTAKRAIWLNSLNEIDKEVFFQYNAAASPLEVSYIGNNVILARAGNGGKVYTYKADTLESNGDINLLDPTSSVVYGLTWADDRLVTITSRSNGAWWDVYELTEGVPTSGGPSGTTEPPVTDADKLKIAIVTKELTAKVQDIYDKYIQAGCNPVLYVETDNVDEATLVSAEIDAIHMTRHVGAQELVVKDMNTNHNTFVISDIPHSTPTNTTFTSGLLQHHFGIGEVKVHSFFNTPNSLSSYNSGFIGVPTDPTLIRTHEDCYPVTITPISLPTDYTELADHPTELRHMIVYSTQRGYMSLGIGYASIMSPFVFYKIRDIISDYVNKRKLERTKLLFMCTDTSSLLTYYTDFLKTLEIDYRVLTETDSEVIASLATDSYNALFFNSNEQAKVAAFSQEIEKLKLRGGHTIVGHTRNAVTNRNAIWETRTDTIIANYYTVNDYIFRSNDNNAAAYDKVLNVVNPSHWLVIGLPFTNTNEFSSYPVSNGAYYVTATDGSPTNWQTIMGVDVNGNEKSFIGYNQEDRIINLGFVWNVDLTDNAKEIVRRALTWDTTGGGNLEVSEYKFADITTLDGSNNPIGATLRSYFSETGVLISEYVKDLGGSEQLTNFTPHYTNESSTVTNVVIEPNVWKLQQPDSNRMSPKLYTKFSGKGFQKLELKCKVLWPADFYDNDFSGTRLVFVLSSNAKDLPIYFSQAGSWHYGFPANWDGNYDQTAVGCMLRNATSVEYEAVKSFRTDSLNSVTLDGTNYINSLNGTRNGKLGSLTNGLDEITMIWTKVSDTQLNFEVLNSAGEVCYSGVDWITRISEDRDLYFIALGHNYTKLDGWEIYDPVLTLTTGTGAGTGTGPVDLNILHVSEPIGNPKLENDTLTLASDGGVSKTDSDGVHFKIPLTNNNNNFEIQFDLDSPDSFNTDLVGWTSGFEMFLAYTGENTPLILDGNTDGLMRPLGSDATATQHGIGIYFPDYDKSFGIWRYYAQGGGQTFQTGPYNLGLNTTKRLFVRFEVINTEIMIYFGVVGGTEYSKSVESYVANRDAHFVMKFQNVGVDITDPATHLNISNIEFIGTTLEELRLLNNKPIPPDPNTITYSPMDFIEHYITYEKLVGEREVIREENKLEIYSQLPSGIHRGGASASLDLVETTPEHIEIDFVHDYVPSSGTKLRIFLIQKPVGQPLYLSDVDWFYGAPADDSPNNTYQDVYGISLGDTSNQERIVRKGSDLTTYSKDTIADSTIPYDGPRPTTKYNLLFVKEAEGYKVKLTGEETVVVEETVPYLESTNPDKELHVVIQVVKKNYGGSHILHNLKVSLGVSASETGLKIPINKPYFITAHNKDFSLMGAKSYNEMTLVDTIKLEDTILGGSGNVGGVAVGNVVNSDNKNIRAKLNIYNKSTGELYSRTDSDLSGYEVNVPTGGIWYGVAVDGSNRIDYQTFHQGTNPDHTYIIEGSSDQIVVLNADSVQVNGLVPLNVSGNLIINSGQVYLKTGIRLSNNADYPDATKVDGLVGIAEVITQYDFPLYLRIK